MRFDAPPPHITGVPARQGRTGGAYVSQKSGDFRGFGRGAVDSGRGRVCAGGGGFSFGSRGARTFSMPSATPTAPRSAAPFERSVTPQPSMAPGVGRPAGFFPGGLGRGLLGGLIGAGLFGMLFGHGLFGGIGGLLSLIGLPCRSA